MSRQPERITEFDPVVKPDGPDNSKPCWSEPIDRPWWTYCDNPSCARCAMWRARWTTPEGA